ncbi:MAG: hypothetical protein QNI90_15845, partial [Dinoroseobacter sp.]|nr:hypothetical protein [Dinoroseobacter sp.]
VVYRLFSAVGLTLAGGHADTKPVCDEALKAHAVQISIEVPGLSRPTVATGTIVSNNGLVLSHYWALEAAGIQPNSLLDRDQLETLKFTIPHRRDASAAPMQAQLIGFDWRRNLILLKMPPIASTEAGLREASLSRVPVRRREAVCPVGFVADPDGGGDKYRVKVADDPFLVTTGSGIYNAISEPAAQFPNSQSGGPVLRGVPPYDLVGMLVNSPNGTEQRFLPIEYADTLLSQLFISQIAREVDEFRLISDEMRTRFSWDFHVLQNDRYKSDDPPNTITDLKIRFFATPHFIQASSPTNRSLLSFKVSATYEGAILDNSDNSRVASLNFEDELDVNGTDSGYFFDYIGNRDITALRNAGFKEVNNLSISFYPVYREGDKRIEERQQTRKFDIPLLVD